MCAPGGPNVNGLAVALLVEHLGRDVAEAARERVQLLLGRVEVFGAVQQMIVRGVPDRADGGEWARTEVLTCRNLQSRCPSAHHLSGRGCSPACRAVVRTERIW